MNTCYATPNPASSRPPSTTRLQTQQVPPLPPHTSIRAARHTATPAPPALAAAAASLLTDDVVLGPACEVLLALVAHQHQVHSQAHAAQLPVARLSLETEQHATQQQQQQHQQQQQRQ